MNGFVVFPAIDLRFGKVVRLRQGNAEQQTIYGDDPAAVAQKWAEQGAEWLHVVDLNGAFGEETQMNKSAIEKIVSTGREKLRIQLGGGIRTIDQVERALKSGVSRVVLGTAVIENPAFGVEVLNEVGGAQVAFGFDVVNHELMTRGWRSRAEIPMETLAKKLGDAGAQTLIYTNIQKDGMQTGVDWADARQLADQTGLSVIASGGTATLADISRVRDAGLSGVIVGRALYEEVFTLQEALDVR